MTFDFKRYAEGEDFAMDNYFTDIVCKIDFILIIISSIFIFLILISAVAKNHRDNKRREKLVSIKNDIYDFLLSGQKLNNDICLPISKDMQPNTFLDIATNRNRELIFFNKSEQDLLKKCFIGNKDNIAKLGKTVNKSKNKWARIEAILSIGYCEIESLLNVLKKSLWDKDKDVSYFSIISLGQIKTTESANILLDFLRKKHFYRQKITSILGFFPKQISDEVFKFIKDKDPNIRFLGLKILTELKPQHHIKDIEKLANDESAEVRSAACECLGVTRNEDVIDTLIKCLKDDMWLVRASTVKALEKILGPKSIPIIINMVRDNSWFVIDTAKNTIAKHIDEAIPYFESILSGKDELAKKICIEIIETTEHTTQLFKDLLSGNLNKKERAIFTLSSILKSSPGHGLETAIYNFGLDDRKAILSIMRKVDKEWTEIINLKLKDK